MLINNKLKKYLCGQSYGSNSERKNLNIDLSKLEKVNTKTKKKKKQHTIGDIVIIKPYNIKDVKTLFEGVHSYREEVDSDRLDNRFRWLGTVSVEVLSIHPTKTKNIYYGGKIVAMNPSIYDHEKESIQLIGKEILFSV